MTWFRLLTVAVVLGALSVGSVAVVDRVNAHSQRTVCATDAATIRAAVATDRAQHGAADVPTMETLVALGFLVRPSSYHSVGYSGTTLVLHATGSCRS